MYVIAAERGKPAGAPKRNYNQLMDLLRLEHGTQLSLCLSESNALVFSNTGGYKSGPTA